MMQILHRILQNPFALKKSHEYWGPMLVSVHLLLSSMNLLGGGERRVYSFSDTDINQILDSDFQE